MISPRIPAFTRNDYGASLSDITIWGEIAQNLLSAHGFPRGRSLRMGTAGTFPTVLVDDQHAVKFFGPHFNGHEAAKTERAVYALLAENPVIAAPHQWATGSFLAHDQSNAQASTRWDYLISTFIPGESYATVRDALDDTERTTVAVFIATQLRRVHALKSPPGSNLTPDWNGWDAFLSRQFKDVTTRQESWKTLPSHLHSQIPFFLPSFGDLLIHPEPPTLIHGDLTADHVLGDWSRDRWIPTAIIDFGDARFGDPIYELVALHGECFVGNRDLLRTFLAAYDWPIASKERFVHHAMALTLLHEFDVLGTLLDSNPELRACETLEALAWAIWDVTPPEDA